MLVRYCDANGCDQQIESGQERLLEISKYEDVCGERRIKPSRKPLELCPQCNDKLESFLKSPKWFLVIIAGEAGEQECRE